MYSSKKIHLRAFTESDARYILEMKMDFTGLKAACGRPYPTNDNNEKEWISKMYPTGFPLNIYFVVEENETQQFIGYCSAMNINYINSNAHVGFFFHKNGRGKGYFKEASILFYGYLFNEINLHKVYSHLLIYNEISTQTNQKIGFKIEGIMKEHIFQNGTYQDAYMIGLTAKDFFQVINLNDYLIEPYKQIKSR